jgi:LCP family protein required for cell wall assembly
VLTAIAAVALTLLVAGAAYAIVLTRRLDHLDVRLHPSRGGGTTYLIVGSDSREGVSESQRAGVGEVAGARADLLLVLRVPDAGPPRLLSIPRDLLVLDDGGALRRLAITWRTGPQATIDALCGSLGLGADHLVEVDLAGFTDVVDAVGGVDVFFPMSVRDTVLDFELPPGVHRLRGEHALAFVRARHLEQLNGRVWEPVPNPRAEHAQFVLRAVARDAEPTVLDPLGTHRLLWSASGAVAVDDDTGLRDLWSLGNDLRGLASSEEIELPAVLHEGVIPFAELEPGAATTLARFGDGGRECRRPSLPEADPRT